VIGPPQDATLHQPGQELHCLILRVVDVRRTVLTKLFLLLGYASGSAICFGSALIVVGLLYNEASLAKSSVFLTYTLFATAAGLYLYFRMLKLLSSKRRIHSYPTVHRPKR
jgi:hypothetical protein